MGKIPYEHFLLSANFVLKITGEAFSSNQFINVHLVDRSDYKAPVFMTEAGTKTIFGRCESCDGDLPSLQSAIIDLVEQISNQTIYIGDRQIQVPDLSLDSFKIPMFSSVACVPVKSERDRDNDHQ